MGLTISSLFGRLFGKKQMRILMGNSFIFKLIGMLMLWMIISVGLDAAGKTTILKKFNGEDINEIAPTLGYNTRRPQDSF